MAGNVGRLPAPLLSGVNEAAGRQAEKPRLLIRPDMDPDSGCRGEYRGRYAPPTLVGETGQPWVTVAQATRPMQSCAQHTKSTSWWAACSTGAERPVPAVKSLASIPYTMSLGGSWPSARASSIASWRPRACVEHRKKFAGNGDSWASRRCIVPGGAPEWTASIRMTVSAVCPPVGGSAWRRDQASSKKPGSPVVCRIGTCAGKRWRRRWATITPTASSPRSGLPIPMMSTGDFTSVRYAVSGSGWNRRYKGRNYESPVRIATAAYRPAT